MERFPFLPVDAWAHAAVIWVPAILALVSGASQYVGLKTEKCFTMYSNLRTEGEAANHLFLPALRWADFQDDLVEILATDHRKLLGYLEGGQLITHFEFRRVVSTTEADFFVSYRRGESELALAKSGAIYSDPSYAENHGLLAPKLLYFRPVDKGEHVRCRHERTARWLPSWLPSRRTSMATADWNGDGKLDLLLGNCARLRCPTTPGTTGACLPCLQLPLPAG